MMTTQMASMIQFFNRNQFLLKKILIYFLFLVVGFILGLRAPSFSGELLLGGDFEALRCNDLTSDKWGSILSPDVRNRRCNLTPNNLPGASRYPRVNGKLNEVYVGLGVGQNWAEALTKWLVEPLTAGIIYEGGFWYAYSGQWKGNMDDFSGRANALFAALLRPNTGGYYTTYYGSGSTNKFKDNRFFYSRDIRFSTPLDADPFSQTPHIPADPTDMSWVEVKSTFTARGGEGVYFLGGQPSDENEVAYYLVDDLSLTCTPNPAFDFIKPNLFSNGIQWQIAEPGFLDVRPSKIWNSTSSLWSLREVTAQGQVKTGGLKKSVLRSDFPRFRSQDTYNLNQLVSMGPQIGNRYFEIIHQSRCQETPDTWESSFTKYLVIPETPHLKINYQSRPCSDPAPTFGIPYEVIFQDSKIGSGTASLIQNGNTIETVNLSSSQGSAVFKNFYKPGSYRVFFQFNYQTSFSNDQKTVSAFQDFKITQPKAPIIQGPAQVFTNRVINYLAINQDAFTPNYYQWSHEDDFMQWVQDSSQLGPNLAVQWAMPGTHEVQVSAVWGPECFSARAATSVLAMLSKPVISLQAEPAISCSQAGDIDVMFTLNDEYFKISSIQGEWFDVSASTQTPIQLLPLSAQTRSETLKLKNLQKPGKYKLKVTVEYEAYPGKKLSIDQSIDFEIIFPTVELIGPDLLYAKQIGVYELQFSAFNKPITVVPVVAWSYEDEKLAIQSGNSVTPLQKLSWNDRGVYDVSATATWAPECSVTQKKSVKVAAENRVFIPTAFSPNGDGHNDLFGPENPDMWISVFRIYNRWGELIHDAPAASTDLIQKWDGVYQGENVQEGAYAYFIQARPLQIPPGFDLKAEEKTYQGTFNLIR